MNEPMIITYHVENGGIAPDMIYLAYIVLPNGEYWGVRFNGATEEIARNKAINLWNKEQEKFSKAPVEYIKAEKEIDPWAALSDGCGHHFAGKVWMRSVEGELKRVALTEIGMYEKNGYYRSGPRSK